MLTDKQKQQLSPMPFWNDYLCFPQPCWHSIVPGKTSMEEALAILQTNANLRITGILKGMIFWERALNSQAGGLISSDMSTPPFVAKIYIHEASEHGLRMKDAIIIFGTPLALHYVFGEGPKADGVYVYFPSNVIAIVYDMLNPSSREIHPDSSIVQLNYSVSSKVPTEHPWTGYSEVEPSL
jgi:hypothetical protein